MMSFTCDTIWPIRLDLSPLECRQMLRERELMCYRDVVSVLRAQGPPSEEKKALLAALQKLLSISDERHSAEVRRAANNEQLSTIAEQVAGSHGYGDWAALGCLRVPPTLRPSPRAQFRELCTQTELLSTMKSDEKRLPEPSLTADIDLSVKFDDLIEKNRLNKENKGKKSTTNSVSTNTEAILKVVETKKPAVTSLEYNLHLLSEIAAGESTVQQVQTAVQQEGAASQVSMDDQSMMEKYDDIELALLLPPGDSQHHQHQHNRHSVVNEAANINNNQQQHSIILPSINVKNVPNVVKNEPVNIINNNNNSQSQRYVLPRSQSQTINLLSNNNSNNQQQRHHYQQQQQIVNNNNNSNSYLTLTNNQMRSPPSQSSSLQVAGNSSWTSQQQQQQQMYIQNISSTLQQQQQQQQQYHQQNISHQTMENLTSFGYTLQQRAARVEQHQQHHHQQSSGGGSSGSGGANNNNNKQNFIVRNLGSQPSMDPERNKRFMVVKGGSSLGPSTKKPKISNPSNRQPGRPPLMPAPSSAYTSRPYVANEIFHTNRTALSATSSITDSPLTDSNGLRISSISSGSRGVAVNSSQMRPNSYYNLNRGNGVQKTSSSGSVVQLGSVTPHVRAMEPIPAVVGTSNTLRPKNIQPVISVVPLSPRGHVMSDNTAYSNLSMGSICVKEEILEHNLADKDLVMPVKVISKDEVYANIMDRVNAPPILSVSHSENKIQ